MTPKTPSHTTQTTEVKLPAWVEKASEENYGLAKDLANRPFEQYAGPRLAGPSRMTTRGYGLLNSSIGAANPDFARAESMYGKSAGDIGKADELLKRASGDLDINKYLNPYTAEVEANAMSNMDRARRLSVAQGSDAAGSAGAFGGSRHAMTEAITNAESARSAGELSAQLRKQGFDTATANALEDMARLQRTAGGYQASAGGFRDTGAGYVGAGEARQKSAMMDVASLLSAGESEQAQRQKGIDVQREIFDEPRNRDIENLNLRLSALGMSPYGKTENMERTGTSEEKGPDWANIGLGAFKMLLPFIFGSDRKMKTDIHKEGRDPTTGLTIYSYRYKGDPKSYPKVVGPMAQEVKKKFPEHAVEVGGKLGISPVIMAATKIAKAA